MNESIKSEQPGTSGIPIPEPRQMPKLPYAILVGTHHKTGTVWLKNVFTSVCTTFFKQLHNGAVEDALVDTDVFLNEHSVFNLSALDRPFRGVHMIRDPRDVIISACHYHQKSEETWLDEPEEAFNGLSYRAAINKLESLEEKLLFEMQHASLNTIKEMLAWNYDQSEFMEVKYEDLMADHELHVFRSVFNHLGFPEDDMPDLLHIAHRYSLFSGCCVKPGESTHVRSGKTKQWESCYTPRLKQAFLDMHGDSLIQLGYERDHAWAD